MRLTLFALILPLALGCVSDPQQGETPRCDPDPSCAGCEPHSPEERCLRCAVEDHVAVCAAGLVPLCTFNGYPPEWLEDGVLINGTMAYCGGFPVTTGCRSGPGVTDDYIAGCWCPRDSTDPDCRVTE